MKVQFKFNNIRHNFGEFEIDLIQNNRTRFLVDAYSTPDQTKRVYFNHIKYRHRLVRIYPDIKFI